MDKFNFTSRRKGAQTIDWEQSCPYNEVHNSFIKWFSVSHPYNLRVLKAVWTGSFHLWTRLRCIWETCTSFRSLLNTDWGSKSTAPTITELDDRWPGQGVVSYGAWSTRVRSIWSTGGSPASSWWKLFTCEVSSAGVNTKNGWGCSITSKSRGLNRHVLQKRGFSEAKLLVEE